MTAIPRRYHKSNQGSLVRKMLSVVVTVAFVHLPRYTNHSVLQTDRLHLIHPYMHACCIHNTMYTTCSTSFRNQGLKCKSQWYCDNMPSQGSTKSHANSLSKKKGTCSPPAVRNTHRLPQNGSPSCTQQKVQTHRLSKSSVGKHRKI